MLSHAPQLHLLLTKEPLTCNLCAYSVRADTLQLFINEVAVNQIQAPNDRQGVGDIRNLASKGMRVIADNRDALFPDSDGNQIRRSRWFSPKDAAELVGVSRVAIIKRIESQNDYPKGTRGANNHRYFTLEEINQMREIHGTRPKRPDGANPFVLAVQHQKGGVSKSVTATHVAHYAAISGYRTLLIDLDAQATTTSMCGYLPDVELSGKDTMLGVYDRSVSIRDILRNTHIDGLDLVPSSGELYHLEGRISQQMIEDPARPYFNFIRNALKELDGRHDIIVIDSPPSLLNTTTPIALAADGIVVPVPAEYPDFATSVQYLTLFYTLLQQLEQVTGPKSYEFFKLLVSRYDANNQDSANIADWIRYTYGHNVLKHPFPLTRAITSAGATLHTLYELSPNEIDRRTYQRARKSLDPLMNEVLELIRRAWERQIRDLEAA